MASRSATPPPEQRHPDRAPVARGQPIRRLARSQQQSATIQREERQNRSTKRPSIRSHEKTAANLPGEQPTPPSDAHTATCSHIQQLAYHDENHRCATPNYRAICADVLSSESHGRRAKPAPERSRDTTDIGSPRQTDPRVRSDPSRSSTAASTSSFAPTAVRLVNAKAVIVPAAGRCGRRKKHIRRVPRPPAASI